MSVSSNDLASPMLQRWPLSSAIWQSQRARQYLVRFQAFHHSDRRRPYLQVFSGWCVARPTLRRAVPLVNVEKPLKVGAPWRCFLACGFRR